MKKLALIGSFCNTQDKLNVLIKNINKLKELKIDIAVVSVLPLPEEVTLMCDFFLFLKENPKTSWPEKSMCFWQDFFLDSLQFKAVRSIEDYGFSRLNQIKKLSEFAITLDYDYFYHIEYDLAINEELKSYFEKEYTNLVFPSKRNETIWKTGLHLMIFNKEKLIRFKNFITHESYYSLRNKNAFDWLEKIVEIMPCDVADLPVEDEIYHYDNYDFFNYSPFEKIKFFIEKDFDNINTIKFYVYSIADQYKLKIRRNNDTETEILINKIGVYDSNLKTFDIKNIELCNNENNFDLTKTIQNINHNIVENLKIENSQAPEKITFLGFTEDKMGIYFCSESEKNINVKIEIKKAKTKEIVLSQQLGLAKGIRYYAHAVQKDDYVFFVYNMSGDTLIEIKNDYEQNILMYIEEITKDFKV